MKNNKAIKLISNLLNILLFAVLLLMIFVVISSKASGGEPNIFGYQLKSVLSGSMEPTFKTGSIIAINPNFDVNQLEIDDIITYKKDQNTVVTHRITEVLNNAGQLMFRTKGDNNEDSDLNPIMSQNVIGKYTGFTIPFVGYLVQFADSRNGSIAMLIIPGLLLLGYSGLTIWRAISEIEGKTKDKSVQH
ncbi:signal peptidase I [Bacillus sp. HMF5848]|uniref:signal peptidase I SipW n=1 Tax=Bacillus sp. HMF5848 TaxID=2495421 RepID=UPI000F7A3902|nr:signal peptidase I [Bacillus sp. HMF5848]RSK26411.1 signal peptidase I [Bacillus sp. HMF5848]